LGLILSRVLPPLPWTRFRRPSSLALPAAAIALTAATRRLGVSIGIGLARSCNPASRTGPNNPPEVPAPSKSQIFEPTTTRAMRSPCGSPTVTRQLSRALDRPHRLCRSHLGLDCGAWPKQPSCGARRRGLRSPEVTRSTAWTGFVTAAGTSSPGIRRPSRVRYLPRTTVLVESSHFAVESFSRPCGFSQQAFAGNARTIPVMPLVGFRVPPESYPVEPGRAPPPKRPSTTPLLSFGSLQHKPDPGIHARGLASPALVRLQGLVTLLTVSAPRTLVGLVSCRQRSWDLSHPSKLCSFRKVPKAITPCR